MTRATDPAVRVLEQALQRSGQRPSAVAAAASCAEPYLRAVLTGRTVPSPRIARGLADALALDDRERAVVVDLADGYHLSQTGWRWSP